MVKLALGLIVTVTVAVFTQLFNVPVTVYVVVVNTVGKSL